MARLELVLYHDTAGTTGVMQWSTTANTGPWTDAALSAPLPLLEALDEWAATIGAAASRTVAFSWDGSGLELQISGGNLWLKLTPALQDLTGFADVIADNATSGSTPLGIAELPIGRTVPRESEQSEITEYRGARVTAYHWGRTGEVSLDLLIPPELWADLEGQPLVSGFGAIKVTWENEDPYGEDDLDGYLLVFPTDAEVEPRQWEDDTVRVSIVGTMLDPGTTAPAGQSTAWARLWRAACYGYSVHYFATIEGVPVLFGEYVGDAIAPANYTLDASLVIDRSSRVGPLVSSASNFAAAFDLEARLMDTAAVRGVMARPSLFTRLRNDASATDTFFDVDSIQGWTDVETLYVGTSAEVVTDMLPRRLITATRGVYGRQRSYRKGTIVTDRPLRWEGRRVEVFAVLRDPTGRYVQGVDVLSNAVMVGAFYVKDRPIRDGNTWVIEAADQVRRLTQPLGAAASGKAVWEVDDDGLVTVDPLATFSIAIDIDGTKIEEHEIRPFLGMSGQIRRSEARTIVAEAFEAIVVTSGDISGFHWRRGQALPIEGIGPDPYDAYGLFCIYAAAGTETDAAIVTGFRPFSVDFSRLFDPGIERVGLPGTAGDVAIYTHLRCITTAGGISLGVLMDDGAPERLPATGWVQMEAAGRTDYRRYIAAAVDATDPSKVNLTIDASTPFSPDEVQAVVEGTIGEVSVKFFWRDAGRIYDILRRAIVSTGDAQHGAHDTLSKGQGLGLPDIDADSFEDVFDAFFRDLQLSIGSESGTSLEELFSGFLRLSQRALTSRRNAAGTAVEIAAVRIGSADSLPVCTINEASLVGGSAKPVRVLQVFDAPDAVEVKVRTLPVGDQPAGDASISVVDGDVDTVRRKWDVDLYGVNRSAVLPAVKAWASGLARGSRNRQVIELMLPAWYDVQGGDVVSLDLTDPNLWDYAEGVTGTPGYVGEARVLGAPLVMTDGMQAVTVMCDGVLSPGPMAPSLPIVAVNGGATTPTSIDVDDAFYDLLVAAKDGESSWKVLAYLPGQDSGRAEYTVSTVTAPGGGVTRLTVTAYPSAPAVTLTTNYRITWPIPSQCTDDQDRYLHASDAAQWG